MCTTLGKSLLVYQIGGMPTVFRLAELLKVRGITQSELARQAGVSFQTVNRLCNNTTGQVSLATLHKLAGVLRVEPGDLLRRQNKGRR